jgi:hypothetical protein
MTAPDPPRLHQEAFPHRLLASKGSAKSSAARWARRSELPALVLPSPADC